MRVDYRLNSLKYLKQKTRLVATGEAIIAKEVESDSLYVHASYLFVTGPDKKEIFLLTQMLDFLRQTLVERATVS
jgi:hypothetical protein